MYRIRFPWLDIFTITFVALAILILVVFPLVAEPMNRAGLLPDDVLDSMKHIAFAQTIGMRLFILGWFTFFGACFASFLNVVAWRVPRGRTINGSSYCPNCQGKLAMTDNIPIYGWIRNQGRCRECRAPISPRYLIVELILGLTTLLIVSLEIFCAGINLPGSASIDPSAWMSSFKMVENLMIEPCVDLLWIAGFHLTLVYLMFTFAVIRNERLPAPLSVLMTGVIVGLIFLVLHPAVAMISFDQGIRVGTLAFDRGDSDFWLTLAIGASTGVGVGWIVDRMGFFSSALTQSAYAKDLAALDAGQPKSNDSLVADAETPAASSKSTLDIGDEAQAQDDPPLVNSVQAEPLAGEPLPQAQLTTVQEFESGSTRQLAGKTATDWPAADSTLAESSSRVGQRPNPYPPVAGISEGIACFGLTGLFLGWQMVLIAAIGLWIWVPVRKLFHPDRSWIEPLASQMFLNVIIMLVSYRWLVQLVAQ